MASVRISDGPSQLRPIHGRRRALVASSLLIAALLAGCAEGGSANEQDFVPQDASVDSITPADSGKDVNPDSSADADGASSDAPDATDAAKDVAIDVPDDGQCPTGEKVCKGACVDATDPANGCGGASCDPCKLANATAKCGGDAGTCAIATCDTGYEDCNNDPSDGCEANTSADPKNCGGCGDACVLPHATANCLGGTCGIDTCDTGFDNCDFDNKTGCETNLNIDPTSCGACETDCTAIGMNACVQGECKVTTCAAGTGDCDITPGCETDVTTSMQHCGYCFNECVLPNATPICLDSTCRVQTCNTGWDNCDGLHPNGCEVETAKSTTHCGACENAECSDVNNSSKSCKDGKCSYTCNAGFADCNGPQPGTSDDGCETPVSADPNNCGGCGLKCTNPHGSSNCEAGLCVPVCSQGWGNCNNDASDGCEASLLSGTATCGSCNTACVNPNGTTSCQQGACVPVCNQGFADCDGNPVNGCETDTQTATNHCGQCGTQCLNLHGTTACQAGVCVPNCAQGFANCDGDPIDGCEAVTTNDPDNCGSCGHKCTNPNGSAACSNSVCTAGCDLGWGDCDSIIGCETNTTNTTAHCGGCFKPCTNSHGTTSCEAAVCKPVCVSGFASCDSDLTNGCETSTATDPDNCGGCGSKCTNAHGSVGCANSVCKPGCLIGWEDCNGNPSDGCETGVKTSTSNCGACGVQCTNSNGSTACVDGLCSPTCDQGFASCDNNPKNGCETPIATDPNNCGACNVQCSNPHGGVACASSKCAPICDQGWKSCDNDLNNGCETSVYDVNNCGACGNKCSTLNATPACPSGTCQLVCNQGFANCDANAATGCEVDLNNSIANCGACNRLCSAQNATPKCTAGACTPVCNAGFASCDGDGLNGCEINLSNDVNNCGGCGVKCSNINGSTSCINGACVPDCAAGFKDCDGNVKNGCETQTSVDPNHCGSCTTVCTNAHGTVGCSNSVCTPGCVGLFASCDGDPIDGCETPLADVNNCGACNNKCSTVNASPSCPSGTCVLSCNSGFDNCDNNVTNGCEASLLNDASNCGVCHKVCSSLNATPKCTAGACTSTCQSGFASCDGDLSNGCEINLSNDVNNCGGCGVKCSNTNGTTSCINGTCVPDCAAGFKDCDGNVKNGCETQTSVDPNNCGACGTKCSNDHGTVGCSNSVCTPGCVGLFRDCDGNVNNGCELPVSSDINNCGACNNKCSSVGGTPTCGSGICSINCTGSNKNCNGSPADGCEVNSSNDINNCGTCGFKCDALNGSPSCQTGSCNPGCFSGFASCDGNPANGCEKNVTADPQNCGACGVQCQAINGTNSCSGSACHPVCNAGFLSCDGDPNDGCEIDITNDEFNCGGCGNACTPGTNMQADCNAGSCNYTCSPGFWDIDGNPLNGCEYACTITNGGEEICDGLDNDCDKLVDDGFDKQNDPNNCGSTCQKCGSSTQVGLCCAGVCRNADANNCGACDQACSSGMLVVTEVMVNPSSTQSFESQYEWVELYNPGAKNIDIRGFVLKSSNGAETHTVNVNLTSPVIVPSHSYRVISGGDKTSNGGIDVIYVYNGLTFGNSSADDFSITAFSTQIDKINWTSSWATSGYSWELGKNQIDPVKNDTAGNWCKSVSSYNTTDHGTPGLINDCSL